MKIYVGRKVRLSERVQAPRHSIVDILPQEKGLFLIRTIGFLPLFGRRLYIINYACLSDGLYGRVILLPREPNTVVLLKTLTCLVD
jgi:hypothetical protein